MELLTVFILTLASFISGVMIAQPKTNLNQVNEPSPDWALYIQKLKEKGISYSPDINLTEEVEK